MSASSTAEKSPAVDARAPAKTQAGWTAVHEVDADLTLEGATDARQALLDWVEAAPAGAEPVLALASLENSLAVQLAVAAVRSARGRGLQARIEIADGNAPTLIQDTEAA